MSETAAKKLNIFPEATEYSLCPFAFFGKNKSGKLNPFAQPNGKALPRALIKMLAYIWTSIKNFGKNVKIPKARLRRKCKLSKRTVSNGLERLIDWKLIEETKPGVYKIVPKINETYYYTLDEYLGAKEFDVAGIIKRLSKTAELILDLIKSFYQEFEIDEETGEKIYKHYDFRNRKPIEAFAASKKSLATRLNLPMSTVGYAIDELIHAELLFRHKRLKYKDADDYTVYVEVTQKGITGNTLSLFFVPYEVLAVEQRSTYAPPEIDFDEDAERITYDVSDAEIEATYAALRAKAEAKAQSVRDMVLDDKEAKNAYDTFTHSSSLAEMDHAEQRFNKRLAELGISQEELSPQYQCTLCNDTGQNLDTGQRCLCLARIKQAIISKFKA